VEYVLSVDAQGEYENDENAPVSNFISSTFASFNHKPQYINGQRQYPQAPAQVQIDHNAYMNPFQTVIDDPAAAYS
jgi:hypothetical protein